MRPRTCSARSRRPRSPTRLGYIRRGTPVLVENRTLADLWERKTPVLAEESTFDPNRDSGDIAARSAVKTRLPPEAFLVGPATVALGADPAQSRAFGLRDWVAPGVIRADTGQIVLNSAQGWCTVDTPQAQGVAAHFAAAPTHQLADVRYTAGNAFGAAMAVSLDGLPLRTSHRVLLQYGTRSRPSGWLETPVSVETPGSPPEPGFSIRSYGHAPWQVERAVLEVTLRNPGLTTATVLDMNGMPAGEVPLRRAGGEVSLRFPPAAMYVVLR